MKILISAAEASSDVHGAQLLKALRETAPPSESVDAFGIGGPELQATGLRSVFDAKELLAMGLFAVIARLPKILSGLRALSEAAASERPDLAVVIDYPDFHFRLAKSLHRLRIPAAYFIPPKVWAWRQSRVRFLSRYFKRLFCILPFEESFYRRRGVVANFVGNPIVDELPFDMTREQARERLHLKESDIVAVLMPGSRPAEVKAHFSLMLDGALRAASKLGQALVVLVPFPKTASIEDADAQMKAWLDLLNPVSKNRARNLEIRISRGDAHTCLIAADAGLIKSGTSTLEAALLGCRHAILYRGSRITGWLFKKFVRYEGPVGLANLAALSEPPEKADRKKLPFREFLMEEARADFLGEELFSLLTNMQRRSDLQKICIELKEKLMSAAGVAEGPSVRVARELWSLFKEVKESKALGAQPAKSISWVVRVFNRVVSEGWSFLNLVMRCLVRWGFLKPVGLGARVISVGNIQAGGAGKTPLVAQIAREAVADGKSVAILLRGYRGRWEKKGGVISPHDTSVSVLDAGDEACLLHELVPQAWIGVGADRVTRYRDIQKQSGQPLEVVILDDGFQNWKIRKDLELVAVTSAKRSERVFRDSSSALSHADLIVWTKGESWPFPIHPMDVKIRYQLTGPNENRKFILVTGVGDGEFVFENAKEAGYSILRHLKLSDHASYTATSVKEIVEDARREGAYVLTTRKDWVKWKSLLSTGDAAWVEVIEPHLIFEEGRERWSKQLWEKSR